MSGNYGIDVDDVASNDDIWDAEQAEETRLAGIIIHD
jgi:hypothetical protein